MSRVDDTSNREDFRKAAGPEMPGVCYRSDEGMAKGVQEGMDQVGSQVRKRDGFLDPTLRKIGSFVYVSIYTAMGSPHGTGKSSVMGLGERETLSCVYWEVHGTSRGTSGQRD
jgi:hypothetical protein